MTKQLHHSGSTPAYMARLTFAIQELATGTIREYDLQYRWLWADGEEQAKQLADEMGYAQQECIVQPDGSPLQWVYRGCDLLVDLASMAHGDLILSQTRERFASIGPATDAYDHWTMDFLT